MTKHFPTVDVLSHKDKESYFSINHANQMRKLDETRRALVTTQEAFNALAEYVKNLAGDVTGLIEAVSELRAEVAALTSGGKTTPTKSK